MARTARFVYKDQEAIFLFAASPRITRKEVIPVAGYDSMLMTPSGAHAPCFTRNLVILEDSAGHTGLGEIHGGDYTCDCPNAVKPLVVVQRWPGTARLCSTSTDWCQFYHTISQNACDIILADPHFWGFDGTVRMSQLPDAWGLTRGVYSNNHFDNTLAAFAQVVEPAPLDPHFRHQMMGPGLKMHRSL